MHTASLRTSSMRFRSHSAARRLVLLTVLVALVFPSSAFRQVSADQSPFAFVGAIPYPTTTSAWRNMVIDPGVARGFSFEEGFPAIAVIDLRTNEVTKTITLPGPVNDGSTGPGGFTVDLAHHRLFIARPGAFPLEPDGCNTGVLAKNLMYVVHTDTLAVEQIRIPCPNPVEGVFVQGMWYDTAADRLYYMTIPSQTSKTVAVGNVPVPGYVMRVDPATGAADPKWPAVRVAPPCTLFANGYPMPQGLVRRVGNKVIGICNANQGTQNYGFSIPLNADGSPDAGNVNIRPLLGGILGASFDDAGGLLLLTTAVQGNAIGTYVLDDDFHFLGTVAAGDTTLAARIKAIGVDQRRGRMYQQNKNGLIVSDIRNTPLPSGISYPELRYKHEPPPEVNATVIPVDPLTRRIYLPDPDSKQWLVYEDRLADIPVVAPGDPDSATDDLDEVAGKTAANYSASANAFGISWVSRGGPTKPIANADLWCQAQPAISQRQFFGGQCVEDVILTPGDRAWYASQVSKLNLSNSAADVNATPVHLTDAPTQQDLAKAESQTGPSGSSFMSADKEYPGDRAACRDFDQGGTADNKSSQYGSVDVKCRSGEALVTADVDFTGASLENPGMSITVANAVTNVSSTRDPKLGIVTEATAIARGIRFGNVAFINEIRTQAKSWANGRPGKASASFTRTIQGYSAPDYKCSTECDAYKVIASLNSHLQSARGEVYAPVPDPEYYPNGSPGGYQAMVTKSEIDRLSDSTVNNDYRDTVAGLKIVFYSDGNLGPSRQIFDFAGVHVESHYGVYALPTDMGGFSGGDGTSVGSAPADIGPISTGVGPAPSYSVAAPKTVMKFVDRVIPQFITKAAEAAWRLLVSEPAAGARLALALMVFGAPVYMAIRRRSFVQSALEPLGRGRR